MSRLLGDAWVNAGGFPPGTFELPPKWEPEVLDRAQRLRDERDGMVS